MGQLVTAEEAKDKWCMHGFGPIFRSGGFGDGAGIAGTAINRTAGGTPESACLGPKECMHWDWWDEESLGDARRGYCGADPLKPNRIGNDKAKEKTQGYA